MGVAWQPLARVVHVTACSGLTISTTAVWLPLFCQRCKTKIIIFCLYKKEAEHVSKLLKNTVLYL